MSQELDSVVTKSSGNKVPTATRTVGYENMGKKGSSGGNGKEYTRARENRVETGGTDMGKKGTGGDNQWASIKRKADDHSIYC